MNAGWLVEITNNCIWAVASGTPWDTGSSLPIYDVPQVVIPINQVGNLTDAEIGVAVRRLFKEARHAQALGIVYMFLESPRFEYIIEGPDEEIKEVIESAKPFLEEFADQSEEVQKALNLIVEYEKQLVIKEQCKQQKRQLVKDKRKQRGIASTNYERLFVTVGRRDGFKCAACGSVDTLQIDHINPVALGGKTELENLQLLCQKDNLSKRTKVIDYRQQNR